MILYLLLLNIFIAVFVIYHSKRVYGTYINHYLLLNIWWLGTISLTFDSPSYPPIHEFTYIVFLGGLFVFNISIILYKKIKLNLSPVKVEYFFNIRHRRIIEWLVFICYFPMMKSSISALMQGDAYWLIREMYFNRETSYLWEALLAYICNPLSQLLFITAYYKYYTNLKKHSYTINLLIAVVLVLCGCFASGGRTGLINFVVLYIIMCLCYKVPYYREVLNINAKFKPMILAIPVVGVIFLTASRNLINADTSLWSLLQFSYGLYGGLFDYYFCGDGQYLIEGQTFGLSTFEGLYLFLNYPFKSIFGQNLFNYIPVDEIIQQPVFLTDSEYPVNAHVSMYFRFLRDWGILGIVIGPLLMSLMFHIAFKMAARKQVYLILYFYLLMQINYTTFDNAFAKNYFVTFLIWFAIIVGVYSTRKKVNVLNTY